MRRTTSRLRRKHHLSRRTHIKLIVVRTIPRRVRPDCLPISTRPVSLRPIRALPIGDIGLFTHRIDLPHGILPTHLYRHELHMRIGKSPRARDNRIRTVTADISKTDGARKLTDHLARSFSSILPRITHQTHRRRIQKVFIPRAITDGMHRLKRLLRQQLCLEEILTLSQSGKPSQCV